METVSTFNNRRCPCCDKEVIGRRNKRFCNEYCRSAFHAERRRLEEVSIRKINKVLRKNRDIMKRLNIDDKTRIARFELKLAGFNFNYVTSTYHTVKGITYYYCYDEGYRMLDEHYVLLVRNYQLIQEESDA